jgi:hypothetical protein
MTKPTIALMAILLATTASADTISEKSCIFGAAQKLPVIPGITIVASRLKDTPPEDMPKQVRGARPPQIIEIDVTAAGQDATFSFLLLRKRQGDARYAVRHYEVTV